MGEIREEPPRGSATVSFVAPEVGKLAELGRLDIFDGANSIKWSYELQTSAQSTYGGEVIQVLGMNVGPLVIQGVSRHSFELRRIFYWIRDYMRLAGMGARSEDAIVFEYPYRGWSFVGHITQAPSFGFGTANHHGIPWTIQMEVQSEEGMESITPITSRMRSSRSAKSIETVTKEHVTNEAGLFQHTLDQLAEMKFSLYPKLEGADITSKKFDPERFREDFHNISENFDRLIASWSAGDFSKRNIDPLADPDSQFQETADEIWERTLGFSVIGQDGSTRGSEATYGGGVPTTKLEIVNAIVSAFEAEKIPGQLAVAVALTETGGTLSPDARQDGGDYAMGLFQTFPSGAGGSAPNKESVRKAFKRSGEDDVTTYNGGYSAQQQIEDAVSWFKVPNYQSDYPRSTWTDKTRMSQWAQRAQRAGVEYDNPAEGQPKFFRYWKQAGELIEEAKSAGTSSYQIDGLFSPLPKGKGIKTSDFGPRGGRQHKGVDIGAPTGTPLYAVRGGKVSVRTQGPTTGYGNYIILESGGDCFLYGHLSSVDVSDGAQVRAGQKIGEVGNTGASTGPHLHFEIRPNTTTSGYFNALAVNPWPTISKFF